MHTKGPWKVDESNDGEHKRVTVITPRYDKPGSYIIADCGRFENHAAQANARLIAAAPALYEIVRVLSERDKNDPLVQDAHAALALADGKGGA